MIAGRLGLAVAYTALGRLGLLRLGAGGAWDGPRSASAGVLLLVFGCVLLSF